MEEIGSVGHTRAMMVYDTSSYTSGACCVCVCVCVCECTHMVIAFGVVVNIHMKRQE
jgi:hypothetical protein